MTRGRDGIQRGANPALVGDEGDVDIVRYHDFGDRRDYAPRREREKQPDPDSPFAKLAALKAQLEAAAKERR